MNASEREDALPRFFSGNLQESRKQMSTRQTKKEIIEQNKRSEHDSGSSEVQIALLTERINHLTGHMQAHSKDYACRRGLLRLVSQRRSLLDYLKEINPQRYLDIIQKLNLRK